MTFRDYDSIDSPQQVWLAAGHGSDVPLEAQLSTDGQSTEWYARLSDVLPAALKHDTPLHSKPQLL